MVFRGHRPHCYPFLARFFLARPLGIRGYSRDTDRIASPHSLACLGVPALDAAILPPQRTGSRPVAVGVPGIPKRCLTVAVARWTVDDERRTSP